MAGRCNLEWGWPSIWTGTFFKCKEPCMHASYDGAVVLPLPAVLDQADQHHCLSFDSPVVANLFPISWPHFSDSFASVPIRITLLACMTLV